MPSSIALEISTDQSIHSCELKAHLERMLKTTGMQKYIRELLVGSIAEECVVTQGDPSWNATDDEEPQQRFVVYAELEDDSKGDIVTANIGEHVTIEERDLSW